MANMSLDESLMFVPSRPVPAKPPKRDSTAAPSRVASPMVSMVHSQTDSVQEAASSNSSESGERQSQQQRPHRGSFSFLSRTKSHEVPVALSPSGRKMLRSKKVRDQEERLRQEQLLTSITHSPPKLPTLPCMEPIESARPDSVAIVSGKAHDYPPPANFSRPKQSMSSMTNFSVPNPYGVPLPPMPASLPRTESIVSRGRESYAPSISASMHSPRRMRRRKDPEAFK